MICWTVLLPGHQVGEDEQHYPHEQQAREEAARIARTGARPEVVRLDGACVVVECASCEYVLDEDADGTIHFTGIDQARDYLRGEPGVVWDGDRLVRCSSDCPGPTGGGSDA
ncbi:hypothetical protein ACQEU3_47135 [Spirillospora sp. CA-253888]